MRVTGVTSAHIFFFFKIVKRKSYTFYYQESLCRRFKTILRCLPRKVGSQLSYWRRNTAGPKLAKRNRTPVNQNGMTNRHQRHYK